MHGSCIAATGMPAAHESETQVGVCWPQVAKLDFLVWLVCLVGTVCLGVGTGLTIAISLVSVCGFRACRQFSWLYSRQWLQW